MNVKELIISLGEELGLSYQEIIDSNRQQRFARGRKIIGYCLYRLYPSSSYATIAQWLGKADHSTAMHYVHCVLDNEELMGEADRLINKYNPKMSPFYEYMDLENPRGNIITYNG